MHSQDNVLNLYEKRRKSLRDEVAEAVERRYRHWKIKLYREALLSYIKQIY